MMLFAIHRACVKRIAKRLGLPEACLWRVCDDMATELGITPREALAGAWAGYKAMRAIQDASPDNPVI